MGRIGVGTLCLWLCAVVCLAQGQDLVNVAPNKTYSQSSTYSIQRSDNMAANGNTSQYFPGNCIHTYQSPSPSWFEVDLGRTYPVYNITLWARHNFQRRLNSSIITVDNQTCASIKSFPTDTREKTVTCPSVMYGQRVNITRQLFQGLVGEDKTLNLCEIQIWVPREVNECEAGRYGTSCDMNCNDHCGKGPGKNFCYQSSGYCYDDCVSGWYGDQCSIPCSPGCQNTACDRQPGHCSPCNTGYEGDTCQDCKDTHYKNSSEMCVQCSANCQSQSCEDATGKCKGCAAGHYGDTCGMSCPKCLRCDQETGVCTACPLDSHLQLPNCTECQDGYYKNGDTCVPCSTDCRAQSCDKTNGTCHGCVDGRYEDKCTSVCPTANCRQCHQTTGLCEECAQNSNLQPPNCTECQDGYYKNGDTCVPCSTDCRAQSCDKTNGTCHGCVDGRYEDKCTSVCPTANCRQCHQTTGLCEECAQNSNLQPPNCTAECQDGYYKNGDTCVPCSTDCRAQSCDKTNGTCHGCVDGRYEDKCTSVCPTANCRQCHQTTGQCEECAQNSKLQPPNCTDCLDGYYKRSDNIGCDACRGICQPGKVCDKITGFCPLCPPGKRGDYCEQDNKNENNTAAIAGAVVAPIVVIIIVVIIVVVVMRRRRCNAKSRGPESGTSNTAQNDGQRREPERPASSPLSFTPLVHSGGKNGAKPKAHVEPLQAAVAKPKPTGADGSVYQNVSPPQRTSATPPRAQTAPQNGTATSGSRPLTDDEELEDLWAGEEPIYSNDPAYTNFIRVDQLQKTIVDSLQDGKVAQEFAFMVGLKQYPLTSGKREENYNKNRFKPIVPYDRNRVILEQLGTDDSSDYINASFVKGYKTDKDYIAAQGPKSNTQDDFWRMVWQEGVTDIVMLTNLKEGNKAKCHEYWPAKGTSVNTGHMEVTGLEEEERAHFIIRTFSVQQLQSKAKRQVSQYHYIKWMDHEVPSTTPLVNFWRYVRARAPRNPRAPPLLVHCRYHGRDGTTTTGSTDEILPGSQKYTMLSAGVGRTGTYIALDILIDQTQEQEEISLYHTVDNLRKYRCHMVQNKSQYQFLHEAVLEAYMSGDCRLQTSSFDHVFPSPIHHDQPHPRIDAEFRRLCQMRTCLTHPSHTVASLEENRHKNRNPDALPDDSHMVYITEQAKGRNQYINAVYMPTFLSSRGSIVTQLPLADTVIDFWRLVDSWNVRTIVSIGQVEGDKGMSRYWPKAEGQPVKCGAYTISLKSVNFLGDTLRSFLVELKKPNQSRKLRVLHYEAWTGQVADNVSDLLRLLDTLHTSHTQYTKEPIIIQCIDGVAQSGAVCALWDVISRMKCDGEVDVYQAVRHVHTVRPEAVTSVVQYRFLYKVAQEFRDSQTTYANT